MASKLWNRLRGSLEIESVIISGKVSIAADASVSSETLKGASVARTAAGVYTITLDQAYSSCLSAVITFQAATAVDLVPQVVSSDVTSAKTVVVRLHTGGVATDPAAVCSLNVFLLLKNSAV